MRATTGALAPRCILFLMHRRRFLHLAGLSLPALPAPAASRRLSDLDVRMPLEQRIRFIESWVHENYFDNLGLMYSHWLFDQERASTPADYDPRTRFSIGVEPHDHNNYENSPMISGIFLAAQCYRYRATKEPAALEYAARAFRSIDVNFRLSEGRAGAAAPLTQRSGHIDPNDRFETRVGWISKPYGQMMTTQTSTEQNFGPVWGMYCYRPLAPPETRRRIDFMIASIARLWREMRYTISFFGEPWSFEQSMPRAQRHMPVWAWINRIAFELTGDPQFQKEFERLHALFGAMPSALETNHGMGRRRYISTEDRAFHDKEIVTADILIDLNPAAAGQYVSSMEKWWEFAGLGMRPDFFSYYYIDLDTVTREWRPSKKTLKPRPLWDSPWMFSNGTFPVASGEYAARRVMSAAMVARRSTRLRDTAKEFARQVFAVLDKSHLRYMIDPENSLEPEIRYLANLLSGDCLAMYPAAYWYGRTHGIWT